MVDFVWLLGLLIAFQTKHLVCDYFLQTRYMLGKFKEHGWVRPLLSHSAVHSIFTIAIVAFVTNSWLLALMLGIFDGICHFVMDRIKASPNMLGKYNSNEKKFWLALGVDQYFHHLTHYSMIFVIVMFLI